MSEDQVWRLRDAANRVIQSCGNWERMGQLRLMVADWRRMRIVLKTPFQRRLHGPEPRTYTNALALAQAEPDLAYVLEIWSREQVPQVQWFQVLHIQWSHDDTERRVVSYRSGSWEVALMRLAPI